MRPRRIVVSDPGSDDLPSLVEITSGDSILGIVSERDIVRAFSQYGQHLMSMFVKDIMQQALITVKLDDSLDHAMKVMTHYRVRHLPVVQNRKLVGIISIGDVVKNRLNDLQMKRTSCVTPTLQGVEFCQCYESEPRAKDCAL